jgi:hypothetical protein
MPAAWPKIRKWEKILKPNIRSNVETLSRVA